MQVLAVGLDLELFFMLYFEFISIFFLLFEMLGLKVRPATTNTTTATDTDTDTDMDMESLVPKFPMQDFPSPGR